MTKLQFRQLGASDPIDVAFERTDTKDRDVFSVQLSDRMMQVEVEFTSPGAGWLRVQGRILPFRIARADSALRVWLHGHIYELELVERTARRAIGGTTATRQSDLQAPMPGTVLKINAQPGESFEAHAALVVMESMKMEMTLSAPHAGRVREVRCRPGQLVEMGAVLVTFAEDGNAGTA